jgi:DNA-binding SARP family transcriptional activator/tetratricopeptide (TPR) repeat protein
MWFGILGPLLVRDGDVVVGVAAARQRVVLAALLVHAGSVVPAHELAELVWDGAPPAGAATTLRSHVMRLRRALGPGPAGRVVTRHPGYLVEAREEEVDLLRFARLCREGGAAVRAGAWQQASELLNEALGLWRGEPLGDVTCAPLRRDELPRLEQLRLQALEWRIDTGLHLARPAELMAELQSLTALHPLRERFHAQLMLALYRCGRQAEALAAYRNARRLLIAELGAEPGPELHELHQQILTADPALTGPERAGPERAGPERAGAARGEAASTVAVVPRELPAGAGHFIGRATELASLTGLLDDCGGQKPIVIAAISGTAGVGKTALAVQWAHQVAGRFPDGQLYVNLRGYDPAQPVSATDALAGFLRSLGVSGEDIPAEEDERAARYRSLLASKRMLVVLDNAGTARQVRPLLPGNPACAVVVTSRDSLAALVARDGARRLDLDLLPLDDAVNLLRALIGERAGADPDDATVALAGQCCRLPLALRVAAELAAANPDVPLAVLVGELADQQRRLGLLAAGGDAGTAVRAVFSWSYRHLDTRAARTFRLAGLHPGTDLDPYSVAALTGTTLGQGRAVLDTLARAHLIQPVGPGRYGMHDLLRAYARELASSHDGEDGQHTALTRLFDHYLHAAATAMDVLAPAERHRRPRLPLPASLAPPVADPAAARAWLDAERATLVAVAVHAALHGWPTHATRLAATLFRYLDAGSHYPEAITIHTHARDAARHEGDRAAEATALNHLAGPHRRQGRHQEAISQYRRALELFRQAGDHTGQAHALGNLGNVRADQGRYQAATSLHEQALNLYRQIRDRAGEARTLGNLGYIEERQGRYRQAARHHGQSLAIARETGNRPTECVALINLGTVALRQDRYQQAAGLLHQALDLCRETGCRFFEAEALTRISDVRLRQGRPREATGHLRAALTLCREIGNQSGEADALNSLGEILLATGQPGGARTHHAKALDLGGQIGDKYQRARAHNGLSHAYDAAGDFGRARSHWQEALTLYAELGAPPASRGRASGGRASRGRAGQAQR